IKGGESETPQSLLAIIQISIVLLLLPPPLSLHRPMPLIRFTPLSECRNVVAQCQDDEKGEGQNVGAQSEDDEKRFEPIHPSLTHSYCIDDGVGQVVAGYTE
ncbi:hypothetical protein A2U01_0030350, partial [Trifolium medium]|nr:hypothetical protein [Trifolium medium]